MFDQSLSICVLRVTAKVFLDHSELKTLAHEFSYETFRKSEKVENL